jgi:hypothetical protein
LDMPLNMHFLYGGQRQKNVFINKKKIKNVILEFPEKFHLYLFCNDVITRLSSQ